MMFSYILSRAVVVRKKGANYSWLRRMVLRRLGYRLEIYQGCVTSCIPKAKCVKKNKKKVIFICACLDIVFTCRFLLFFKFWLWKWRGNALTAIVTSSKCKDEMQTNQFSQNFLEEIIPDRNLAFVACRVLQSESTAGNTCRKNSKTLITLVPRDAGA